MYWNTALLRCTFSNEPNFHIHLNIIYTNDTRWWLYSLSRLHLASPKYPLAQHFLHGDKIHPTCPGPPQLYEKGRCWRHLDQKLSMLLRVLLITSGPQIRRPSVAIIYSWFILAVALCVGVLVFSFHCVFMCALFQGFAPTWRWLQYLTWCRWGEASCPEKQDGLQCLCWAGGPLCQS